MPVIGPHQLPPAGWDFWQGCFDGFWNRWNSAAGPPQTMEQAPDGFLAQLKVLHDGWQRLAQDEAASLFGREKRAGGPVRVRRCKLRDLLHGKTTKRRAPSLVWHWMASRWRELCAAAREGRRRLMRMRGRLTAEQVRRRLFEAHWEEKEAGVRWRLWLALAALPGSALAPPQPTAANNRHACGSPFCLHLCEHRMSKSKAAFHHSVNPGY